MNAQSKHIQGQLTIDNLLHFKGTDAINYHDK